MDAEKAITQLGLELPPMAAPVGAYVHAVATGNLIYTAGQLPLKGGTLMCTGKVPSEVSLDHAQAAARQAALNGLAAVRSITGTLDSVVRIVRLNVFVNSAAGFIEQAKVANGASELLVQVFGQAGKHTRVATGTSELPLNSPLELDMIVEFKNP